MPARGSVRSRQAAGGSSSSTGRLALHPRVPHAILDLGKPGRGDGEAQVRGGEHRIGDGALGFDSRPKATGFGQWAGAGLVKSRRPATKSEPHHSTGGGRSVVRTAECMASHHVRDMLKHALMFPGIRNG